jgi:hypothetical protein
MYKNNLFESLKEIVDNQNKNKKKRLEPKTIYLDENNEIKEKPLPLNDSSTNALINHTIKKIKQAKLIHDSIFK